MIQPDMFSMRITSPVDSAMAPAVIEPCCHSHKPRPAVTVTSKALSTVKVTSMAVVTRVICRTLSTFSRTAPAT